MNLTEEESNSLRKLKRFKRQLYKARWGFFLLSLVLSLMSGYMIYLIVTLNSTIAEMAGGIEFRKPANLPFLSEYILFVVSAVISCMTAIFFWVITAKSWIGDPRMTLLIGLAEKIEAGPEQNGAGQPDNHPEKP